MSENIIQYTTKENQRWDTVALECYGSALMMNKIIEANPDVQRHDLLPGGIVLNIPIIDKVEVQTDAEMLPFWKR